MTASVQSLHNIVILTWNTWTLFGYYFNQLFIFGRIIFKLTEWKRISIFKMFPPNVSIIILSILLGKIKLI